MTFDSLLGYILSISMCMQKFHHNSLLSSAIFTFSESLARPMLNVILKQLGLDLAIPLSRSCQYMGMQNFIKIYEEVQEIGPVSLFFRI